MIALVVLGILPFCTVPALANTYSTGTVSTANPLPANGWYRTLAWSTPGSLSMTMAASKAMSNAADDAFGSIYGSPAYNNWGSTSPLIPANMAPQTWSGVATGSPYTPGTVANLKGLTLGFYTPEVCAGVPAPAPGVSRGCDGGTVTFTFSRPVQDAVFHIADAGAGDNPGGSIQSSCPTFTVTGGRSLTLLSSAGNVSATSTALGCARRVETGSPNSTGVGYASARVNGTYTSVTFNVSVTWWTTVAGGGSSNFLEGSMLLWSVPDVAPTAVNDSATTPMNTPVTLPSLSNDTGNALQITAFGAVSAKGGTVTSTGTGFTYTPRAGFAGTDTFSYTVTDAFGRTRTATDTITVLPPPPTTVDDQAYGEQGKAITVSPLANDSAGSASAPLAPGALRICAAGTLVASCNQTSLLVSGEGTYTVNPDGTVTLVPVPGFTGQSTIGYIAVDSMATPQRALGSMVITLLPPPATVANADSATATRFRQPVSIDPLANDSAGTIPATSQNGYTQTGGAELSSASVFLCGANETAPQCTATSRSITGVGSYTLNPDKTITFTPYPTYSGTAPGVPYVVCNTVTPTWAPITPSATCASSTFTPTIPAPEIPVALPDATETPWNTPVTLTPRGNDTRDSLLGWAAIGLCDDSDCTKSSVTIDGEGTYAVANDGTVTFTPDAAFTGTSSIRYTTRDDLDQEAESTIAVAVRLPIAPTAQPEEKRARVGEEVTFNPSRSGTQIVTALCDASDCTKSTVTIGGEGTYAVNGDGTVLFVPVAGFTGTSSLRYQVEDVMGQTQTALLMAIIEDPPVVAATGSGQTAGASNGAANPATTAKAVAPSVRIAAATVARGSRLVVTVRVNRAGRVSVAGVLGGVKGCTATAKAKKAGVLSVSCVLGASAQARAAAGPAVLRTVARLSVSGRVARDAARSTVQPFAPTPVTG